MCIFRVVRFPTIGVLEDLPGVIIVSLNQKFYFGVSFIDCVINRNSSKVTALNFLTFVNSKLNEKNEIILSIIQYSRFNYN